MRLNSAALVKTCRERLGVSPDNPNFASPVQTQTAKKRMNKGLNRRFSEKDF